MLALFWFWSACQVVVRKIRELQVGDALSASACSSSS